MRRWQYRRVADELEILAFESAAAFEAWLDEHHDGAAGVLVKLAKKGSGVVSVSYDEALEVALCYGWIDGQVRRFDECYYLQRFTPRRKRSMWSKRNRTIVARLIEAGRMRAAGHAQIARARADGRWDAAYDGPASATVPDDLKQALRANPAADSFFQNLNSANRYAVLWRIQTARSPATRAKRIGQLVTMLTEGRTLHP